MGKCYLRLRCENESIAITAEQADKIKAAWESGAIFITLNGNTYACNQILSIKSTSDKWM